MGSSLPHGNLYRLIKTVFHFAFETIFCFSDSVFRVRLFLCVCTRTEGVGDERGCKSKTHLTLVIVNA